MNKLTEQTLLSLNKSEAEKDVENSYRQFISARIPDMLFTSPFKCDGYGVSEKYGIRLLCEFKKDENLKKKSGQVDIIVQGIFYVKKFELAGLILPNILLLGDRDEWFLLHVNSIFKYLSMRIDWSIAPSSALEIPELYEALMEDDKITPFVFSVNEIDAIIEKIKDLAKNVTRLISITPHNITEVFSYFEKNVLGNHKLNTNQLANLFVQILINPDENYLHPVTRRKTIVTKTFNEIPIKDKDAFTSFFKHFSPDYTPTQKEDLTAVVDRLVQDVTRRKQGEFFTPTIWVDKAYEYIDTELGSDWKDEYVVWDCCWGTGNLTRDNKFKELYVSTLIYEDIQTANQMGYNPEATKFQYDFLNDDYEFLPKKLRDVIESQKKMVLFINSPYTDGSELSRTFGESDLKGNTSTKMNEMMLKEGWGKSSKNLYSQFLYRICKLQEINKNIKICQFSPPLFLTGDSYKDFRVKFFDKFSYMGGFLFQASNFSEVSSDWGISFTMFSGEKKIHTNKFTLDVLQSVQDDDLQSKIEKISEKTLYNTDGLNTLTEVFTKKIKVDGTYSPELKGFNLINNKESLTPINYFGTITWQGNNVMGNTQFVTLFSGNGNLTGKGRSFIDSTNFIKILTFFSSRKLFSNKFNNWVNQKDEYLVPNENHPKYQQYTYDSVVYSLFNNSSQQSSLRQIIYKDKLWDIKNEFFWLSKQKMMDLANTNHYTELYNDTRTSDNRYVHTLLFSEQSIYNQLSPDAKLVLDKATELVEKSMRQRQLMADETNHLNSWDAGYAQLKLVWKEYFPKEFKEFRQLYKNLEDRMRPLVYELGFLLK